MKENRSNAFLKGTISLSLSVIITKILGVGFKVPLSYVLGDGGMGYFNTAYAIYGFFYILCTAGVPKSMMLVLSEYRAMDGGDDADHCILASGLRMFFKIGLLTTLLIIICAPALASVVGNKKATLSLIAVAPSILFVSLSGVLRGYLNSHEKLTAIAVSQLAEGAVKLVLGLAFAVLGVYLRASVHVISALSILGIAVGSMISYLYLFVSSKLLKCNNKCRQNDTFAIKQIERKIVKNALPMSLGSSLLNLSALLDLAIIIKRLVLNGASADYANAIYGNYTTLAVPMFNLVIAVLTPIATSYMPSLADMSLKGENGEFSKTVKRIIMITLLISVPASLAFYFYSFDILDVLFSVQSSAIGASMLICLSFGVCLLSLLTVVNTALESRGRTGIATLSLLVGCIVKLIMGYILIGNASIGILGAPIGTVMSYAVSLLISLFALELEGVRTASLLKLFFGYLVGFLCFLPPYKFIYSQALFSSSFTCMLVSASVSFFAFCIVILISYVIKTRLSIFKMHKK